ncbi:MAG: hypothetical protein KAI50_11600 [Desulfobacterales bacterium]|nr:hypothetical protein [Desulfobacterales bacterium]
MLSLKFKLAIKTSPYKAYEIAHKSGLHPSTLSKLVCGIEKVKERDSRVLKVGKVLGIKPEECFEKGTEVACEI